jgi:hypothetical protein
MIPSSRALLQRPLLPSQLRGAPLPSSCLPVTTPLTMRKSPLLPRSPRLLSPKDKGKGKGKAAKSEDEDEDDEDFVKVKNEVADEEFEEV